MRAPLGGVVSAAAGSGEPDRVRLAMPMRPRALLENILFFAHDSELVSKVFESACDLVRRVPVYRLTFVPDARVWELIV